MSSTDSGSTDSTGSTARGAIEVPNGTRGFDCDTPVSFQAARAFMAAGMRFVCRYVPRVTAKPTDMSAAEVAIVQSAGLALMPVQHVEMPGWTASADKGTSYGTTAARHSLACGVALGTCVWLDLEGVGTSDHETVIGYCNAWYVAVARVGYTPGIYVGYEPTLTAAELYGRLRFEHYWAAYNLNGDQYPAVRGVQMQQAEEQRLAGIKYDPDVVKRDKLGGLPLAFAPAEWDV